VLSIIPNANDLVAASQRTGPHPPIPGFQYFIARIQLKYVGTASQKFSTFSAMRDREDAAPRLAAVGKSNIPYRAYVEPFGPNPPGAQTCIYWPEKLPNKEMFPGETLTGNACWHVRTEDVPSLVMFDDQATKYLYLSLH